jgi:hypothetical protein
MAELVFGIESVVTETIVARCHPSKWMETSWVSIHMTPPDPLLRKQRTLPGTTDFDFSNLNKHFIPNLANLSSYFQSNSIYANVLAMTRQFD